MLWDLNVGYFTMKIAELKCSLLLRASPPTLKFHPYISACGVDKTLSKMARNSASYALWRG